MDRMAARQENIRREQRAARILAMAAIVLLFCGLCAQITVRAQISERNKQIAAVEKEIEKMEAEAKNLRLYINQYHNVDEIGVRAEQLGMFQPTGEQLRVVSLHAAGDTSAQTVANVGGEENIG